MPNIFRKGLFEGQVAVVTGGGSGIGLSTAIALGELGARIAICGRKKDKLEAAERDSTAHHDINGASDPSQHPR